MRGANTTDCHSTAKQKETHRLKGKEGGAGGPDRPKLTRPVVGRSASWGRRGGCVGPTFESQVAHPPRREKRAGALTCD